MTRIRVAVLSVFLVAAGAAVASAAPSRIDRAAVVTERAERVDRAASQSADVRDATKYEIDCSSSEERVAAAGGPRLTSGTSTIYIGTAQVRADNQDPRLVRFDGGVQTWCRADLEVTGDDHRGHGLLWDGADRLYAVFTATGTQGQPSQDFRRFATDGWLRSYSDASAGGGGPKVSIVARIDPDSGAPAAATFLTARLSSGRINSFRVDDLAFAGDDIVVTGSSFFSPRGADREPLTCDGGSPFDVRYVFDAALGGVESVDSDRCR